ncbi:inorganic phosphate transporter [Limnochorda pilosa]|uniref:Sulfate permease n=1 Tax=Limnochorda pilosa TaxID=1555112 RepID=A0A0K2SN34_LIMPI|nr:inorganic phosphate transporter [Limnochorda pilosa]BAS28543.1 sulfate permease [Limnochorda pilosa]
MPVVLLVLASFFGLNIGASGAASLAIPYGAGVLDLRRALQVAALGLVLGAAVAGNGVVRTLGAGLLERGSVPPGAVAVVLAAASASLALATRLGVPISTSEVTVAALAGVGLATGELRAEVLVRVVAGWILLPVISFAVAYGCARVFRGGWLAGRPPRSLGFALGIAGFLQAFAAGANNAANAVGPLVAEGFLPAGPAWPAALGGLWMGAGAWLLGGPLLHMAGREMARFSLAEGALAAGVTGFLVLSASLMGLPVPLTQALTLGLVGVTRARRAAGAREREAVRRATQVWVATPVVAFSLALGAVRVLFR